MKGDIAMNGHKVTGMGDPTADAQAANKRYVDTRLKRTGGTGQKMEGMLYMGGHKIAGIGDPDSASNRDHAANRRFVEAQIAAIPKTSQQLAVVRRVSTTATGSASGQTGGLR